MVSTRDTVPDPARAGDAVRASRRALLHRGVSIVLLMWCVAYVLLFLLLDVAFVLVPVQPGRAAVALGVLALPGLWCLLLGRKRWQRVAFASAIGLVLLVLIVPWSERKQFVRDLYNVERGMTVEQVEAVMDGWGYAFGEAYTQRPEEWPVGADRDTFTGSLGYRWTPGGTADWGHVRFAEGRVTDIHWSPD